MSAKGKTLLPDTLPPPAGCIGPPEPLPVTSIPRMRKAVLDCAGVPLDKEVVDRLAYMVRRAHGIGWNDGRKGKGKETANPKHKRKRRNGRRPLSDPIRRLIRGT